MKREDGELETLARTSTLLFHANVSHDSSYGNVWWRERGEINIPSSQTSVSILTASALLCRCSVLWPFVGCLKQLLCCCCCCIGFSIVAVKNGTNRTCESPMRPGVVSTPSSKSIISDDDSDSDDFFKCWPEWEEKITSFIWYHSTTYWMMIRGEMGYAYQVCQVNMDNSWHDWNSDSASLLDLFLCGRNSWNC